MSKFELHIILSIIFITVVIYSLELFFYPGFTFNKFGFHPTYIYLPSIVGILIYRFILKEKFPNKLLDYFLILAPVITIVCATIQVIHPLVHANFFFNTFHIHPPQLEPIALYVSAIVILSFDLQFLKRRKDLIIFIAPIWLLMLTIYFKWNFEGIFWYIEKEDSITEYLTFFTYLFVSYCAFVCICKIHKVVKSPRFWKWFYISVFSLIAIVSLFIAGEEISWGQRILGFSTPNSVAQNNTQLEFNIHNQKSVFQYVYLAYALLGLYCATAWIFVKVLRKLPVPPNAVNLLNYFSPSPKFIGLFVPIIVYAYLRGRFGDVPFDRWEELMEFYLQ
ncbi:MAG TPA: hypothetical protein PLS49_04370 [Candidatus Woesebacteria bacterium]|nr:hypothetical protein [Candidatus Woesebacteria bacterium]